MPIHDPLTPTPRRLALLLGASLLLAAPAASTAAPGTNHKNSHNFNVQISSGGQLGAQVTSMSDDLRKFFGAPEGVGLLVDRVLPDSPAARAGLKSGDVITAANGNSIAGPMDIFQALAQQEKGDKVSLEVIRNHKKRRFEATLDGKSPLSMHWGTARAGGSPFGKDHPFGKNHPFGKDHPFAESFPFEHGDLFGEGDMKIEFGKDFAFAQGAEAMQEKIRRLEERLNRLEGNKAPKAEGQKNR